jgi:hypothetical protein
MKQLDEKELREYRMGKQLEEARQPPEVGTEALKETENEGKKGANFVAEEAQQNLKEVGAAKQKANLIAEEAQLRLIKAEVAKQKANLIAEEAKRKANLAIEQARQMVQEAVKARQKEKEAQEIRQRVNGAAEEAERKVKEAEEAKRVADLAVEEAQRRVLAAEEGKRREKQQAEEAKQKGILASEEAKQAKEPEKAGVMCKKQASGAKMIPSDNKDFLSGSVKLLIDPGARGSKILRLIDSLSDYSDIKIVSMASVAEGGPWVELFVRKPISLYQVLYSCPVVQQVAGTGSELQITMREGD